LSGFRETFFIEREFLKEEAKRFLVLLEEQKEYDFTYVTCLYQGSLYKIIVAVNSLFLYKQEVDFSDALRSLKILFGVSEKSVKAD